MRAPTTSPEIELERLKAKEDREGTIESRMALYRHLARYRGLSVMESAIFLGWMEPELNEIGPVCVCPGGFLDLRCDDDYDLSVSKTTGGGWLICRDKVDSHWSYSDDPGPPWLKGLLRALQS